jgi:hypothetical protein
VLHLILREVKSELQIASPNRILEARVLDNTNLAQQFFTAGSLRFRYLFECFVCTYMYIHAVLT